MYDIVQDYYGKQLQSSSDLKTTVCCDASAMPSWLKPLLSNIHPEVLSRYYGCGLVCPPLLAGCRVLDLGCGSGRDVYALAQLVGAEGEVVGVDMTDEQLGLAESHQDWHADAFGYSNVRVIKGYIEKLDELDLEPNSFDVIVSNPPYIDEDAASKLMKDVRDHEPVSALVGGVDGLDAYRILADQAADYMAPGGLLALEIGFDQGESVLELLKHAGWQSIEVVSDLAGNDRVVLARSAG